MKYIVAVGNICEGFTFHGPFESFDEAAAHTSAAEMGSWVAPINYVVPPQPPAKRKPTARLVKSTRTFQIGDRVRDISIKDNKGRGCVVEVLGTGWLVVQFDERRNAERHLAFDLERLSEE